MTKTTSTSKGRICHLFRSFEFLSRAAQALAPRVRYCPSTWLRVVSLSNHFGFRDFSFHKAEPMISELAQSNRFALIK